MAAADRQPGWRRRTGAAGHPTGRRPRCRRAGRCGPAEGRKGTGIQRSPRTGTVVAAEAAAMAQTVAVAAGGQFKRKFWQESKMYYVSFGLRLSTLKES